MADTNPYQSPSEVNAPASAAASPDEATAREVFLAWEKLRLPYNVVLALVALGGLALEGTEFVERRELLKALAGGAVLANLCFCAGPCAEGYLVWIGTRRRATRVVVFVV